MFYILDKPAMYLALIWKHLLIQLLKPLTFLVILVINTFVCMDLCICLFYNHKKMIKCK